MGRTWSNQEDVETNPDFFTCLWSSHKASKLHSPHLDDRLKHKSLQAYVNLLLKEMHLAHEDAESIWNQCCYCWWWSWKGGRVGEQENADDEMMMSYHSDEYMHCYFRDVSINIRRKWGEKYGNIMYRRHGLWRFANEKQGMYLYLYGWVSTRGQTHLHCYLMLLVFQTSKSWAIGALEGVGVMGYGGNSWPAQNGGFKNRYLIHAWVWKTGFE